MHRTSPRGAPRSAHHCGRVSTGLRFQHADGTPYGSAPAPETSVTFDKVFRALRGLGFKEREARQALDAVMRADAEEALPPTPTAKELLRAALRMLGPRGARGR